MKLPFFNKNTTKEENYLGLFLKEEEGIAMIISDAGRKMAIARSEKFAYTDGWENFTEDIDGVLFRLEKDLKKEIRKTIFFVYSHLIDDVRGDIKKPYLQKIKQTVKELELEALGYIECFDAVALYLEKKEQMTLNAVLIELDLSQISIFISKGGKIIFKKNLSRTSDITDDMIQGLDRFKGKGMLPSRVILYDSGDLERISTQILTNRWSSEFFIQVPKVDVIPEEEIVKGLIAIFENQITDREKEKSFVEPEHKEILGFVVNQDIKLKKEDLPAKEVPRAKLTLPTLPVFPKLPISIKNFRLNINWSNKFTLLIGSAIIIVSLFINELYFHKADLSLFLPSQDLAKSAEVSLGYRIASSEADFNHSIESSGKREVGEKSRGTVTVHNFDDKEKPLSKGTLFEASNRKFVLDSDVKVASSSITPDGSAKLPGKANAQITAQAIGPDSNLGKNQRLIIENLPQSIFFAINESALSGGTKKEVRTVSTKDLDDLEKLALDKSKEVKPTIKLKSEEAIASQLTETKVLKSVFSKEVGEEAEKVEIRASLGATYYIYNKGKLDKEVIAQLKPLVKGDLEINTEQLNYKINNVDKNDGVLAFDVDIKTKATKKISKEDILKSVTGKSEGKVNSLLQTNFKVQAYKLYNSQPIPFLKKLLPFFKKNINLKISTL